MIAILGYILVGLLGILLFLLLVPASVSLAYRKHQFTLAVRLAGIKVWGLPAKKKKARKPKKPKKQKTKEASKDQKKEAKTEEKSARPKTPTEILELVRRIAVSASAGMRILAKGLWIRGLEIVIPIGGDDAAEIAITRGRLQGVFATTYAALENIVKIQYKRIDLIPDFADQHTDELAFSCKIVSNLFIMLVAAIVGFVTFLRYKKTSYTVAEYVEAQKLARQKAAAGKKNNPKQQSPPDRQ